MMAKDFSTRWTHPVGAAIALSALAFTTACTTAPQATTLAGQPVAQGSAAASAAAGTPVVVSCEPHQRTLVRAAAVNGTPVSQVECVAAAPAAVASAFAAPPAAPVHAAARQPVPAVATVAGDLPDAQVIPVSSPAVRTVRASQVVYDERPIRKKRSVAKSAIIIGSSAGAGAGIGAAVGGKKGALIGAAVGGGGATLWDQLTRRK